jgi:hypothetical protein
MDISRSTIDYECGKTAAELEHQLIGYEEADRHAVKFWTGRDLDQIERGVTILHRDHAGPSFDRGRRAYQDWLQ